MGPQSDRRPIGPSSLRLSSSLVVLLSLCPVGLHAQAGAGEEEDTLVFSVDPVVVTATRGPREASTIPRPISVVQRRQLSETMPNTISDVFRSLPGVDVTGVGVNQGRPQIRGQRGQRILLLADGLRLNNSRRQQDFGELPALVDVNGIDRVEIVRGPASVLYGSDAIGGVVNVISRVPRADGLHGDASFRYGGVENQRSGTARAYGRFGNLTVRAGGTIREADSYEAPKGTFGRIELANDVLVDGSGTSDRTFDLRLGYETGAHSVFGKIERYQAEGSGFGSVDPSEYGSGAPEIRITYPSQTFSKFSAGYRARDLTIGFADRVELLVYGQENERELAFGIGPFAAGPVATIEIDNLNTTDIRTYGARLEARKLAMPELLLTYGLDLWRDRARGTDTNTTTMTGFGPAPIVSLDDRPQLPEAAYLSLGAFVQGELEATDRWSFVGGARWQHVSAETFETVGLEDQDPVDITDGTIVAAINSIVKVSEELSLVGSVGRAFRSPNLIERFFDGPTPEGSGYQVRNPGLGPETSLNLDVGFRYRSDRFGLELFRFFNRINDGIRIQSLGYDVGGAAAHQNVNVDELSFRGMEVAADVDLGAGLLATGSFTWMETEDVNNENNPVGDSFSNKLTGGLRYQPTDRLWVAGEVRRNGDQKNADLGTSNPIGLKLPAFTVVNLRGGVTVWRDASGMTHRLNLALTNLTNELYAEFSNAGFFRPEPKRNLTLTWNVSF